MLKDSYALPRADNSPPVILIADDDDDSRLMLKFLLESWNYLVIEAVNGAEAFCIAETEKPDLILMDVRMPDLDGFETARKIRESGNMDGVPIIFLSGCAEQFYRDRTKEAGGNDYLVKPLDFDRLANTLGKYL